MLSELIQQVCDTIGQASVLPQLTEVLGTLCSALIAILAGLGL